MKQWKHIKWIVAMLSLLVFLCNESSVWGKEETETVYYYIVQPGDNLWKIAKEIYGDGADWKWLYNDNARIFEPALIYPGMELEISSYAYPEDADDRFATRTRKAINFEWLAEGYIHVHSETGKREEYPERTEKEAFEALQSGKLEDWFTNLTKPEILTEEEKEHYRKADVSSILYSYETERGLPEDIWYLVTESDGTKQLLIENWRRGKHQYFYWFQLDSGTDEIRYCERVTGAGGRLYMTREEGMPVWIMTKEKNGKITGIAGDYRGVSVYIGGNFYYEKQKNGVMKVHYQDYASIGSGTIGWDERVPYQE